MAEQRLYAGNRTPPREVGPPDEEGMVPFEPKPQEWMVNGLLKPRGVHLLAGQSGLGKTELMLKLSRALSHSEESFLHRAVERPHLPMLIQNDMDRESMSAQMYYLGFKGMRPCDIYYDKMANDWSLRDHMMAYAAQNPTGLIMIDTFSATFLDVEQNKASAVTDAYKALAEWHPNGPILISHHCNKPTGMQASSIAIRGSNAFYEKAERVWLLHCAAESKEVRLEVTKRGPEMDLYVKDATDNQIDRALTPGAARREKPESEKRRTVDCQSLHDAMQPMKIYGYDNLVELMREEDPGGEWNRERVKRAWKSPAFEDLILKSKRGEFFRA